MGRKGGGIASIFSSKPKLLTADSPSTPWPWPSCATTPQTASFRRPGRHADDRRPSTTTTGYRRSSQPSAPTAAGRLRPPPRKAGDADDEMYKTVNSVYFDAAAHSGRFFLDDDGQYACGGFADGDLDDDGFSTTTASEEWSEAVIRSLGRSTSTDRFFFDAGPAAPASNSILAASPSPSRTTTSTRALPLPPPPPLASKLQALSSSPAAAAPGLSDDSDEEPAASTSLVEESVAVAVDSEDPFGDFRASMEEMVAAHGLRDWAALQEMLIWYLRINGKRNHALIVGAFVDLLVGLATNGNGGASASTAATTASTTTATTTTSACSTSTTSSSSSSSSSSGSSGGGGGATAAAAATMPVEEEQCGGGGSVGASCSSALSSDVEEEEKASDWH